MEDRGNPHFETRASCPGDHVAPERLDAAGLPLVPESSEIPAAIRFTGAAGSFSTGALCAKGYSAAS